MYKRKCIIAVDNSIFCGALHKHTEHPQLTDNPLSVYLHDIPTAMQRNSDRWPYSAGSGIHCLGPGEDLVPSTQWRQQVLLLSGWPYHNLASDEAVETTDKEEKERNILVQSF